LDRTGEKSVKDIIFTNELMYKYRHNIYLMPETIQNNVSSTKIRLFTKRGFSIKYLVPDGVAKYIEDQKLYK
jgi:nicotinamide mononucleotide adenylyltransferase